MNKKGNIAVVLATWVIIFGLLLSTLQLITTYKLTNRDTSNTVNSTYTLEALSNLFAEKISSSINGLSYSKYGVFTLSDTMTDSVCTDINAQLFSSISGDLNNLDNLFNTLQLSDPTMRSNIKATVSALRNYSYALSGATNISSIITRAGLTSINGSNATCGLKDISIDIIVNGNGYILCRTLSINNLQLNMILGSGGNAGILNCSITGQTTLSNPTLKFS